MIRFSAMELQFHFLFSCILTINLPELADYDKTTSLYNILLSLMQIDSNCLCFKCYKLHYLFEYRVLIHVSACSIYFNTENRLCACKSVDSLKKWQCDSTEHGKPILKFPTS